MKSLISFLCLAAIARANQPAVDSSPAPTDSMTQAIMQGTTVRPNPPPEPAKVAAEVSALPSGAVVPSVSNSLPKVPGEGNAVFSGPQPEVPTSDVIGHLQPGLASDLALDAVTKERARIRLIGDYEAQFRGAAVGDVVRALADHAQMRYVAPANDSMNSPVTIAGNYNTLDLLDVLQEHFGVSMSYDRGIWRFSKASPDSLILKSYHLANNNREEVEITSPEINSIGNAGGSNTNTTGTSNNNGTNGSVNTSNASFKVSYTALTKDIEDLLTAPLPPREDQSSSTAATPATPRGAR